MNQNAFILMKCSEGVGALGRVVVKAERDHHEESQMVTTNIPEERNSL